MRQNPAIATPRSGSLPPSPYGSPPIYLPFAAVTPPLQQAASPFGTTIGWNFSWYPFAPITAAGWNEVLQSVVPIPATPYYELLNYAMPSGVQDMIVPFAVEKVSPNLLLSGPMIVNVVDQSPLAGLSFTVTNLSTSLMAIQLNALLPSPAPPQAATPSNYRFMGLVTVVGP